MKKTINKNLWRTAADILYNATLHKFWSEDIDVWSRLDKHRDGYYETPKKFVNGVATNDGTWLRYKTERWSHGKLVTKITCTSKNDVIKILYEYLSFLKLDGLTITGEMMYYAMKLIIDKMVIPEGIFEYNEENRNLIQNLVEDIKGKPVEEITCDRKDPRKTAFDPNLTKHLSKTNILKIGKRIKKKERDDLIAQYYHQNPDLSYRKIAKIMNEDGIKISKSTIENWVKNNE